ncbi:uncharacterized protein LOC131217405 isoform X4 [Magnolia sinica]|uniref:uncharacterized protein LOC131217405 isoform X4 n=1 Tax=Magnolia sinica TaxID=86752 RepID=UPI0026596258|nr:uncharacterized protein LOC131217405 isoform X4 [Magnolia sinica]
MIRILYIQRHHQYSFFHFLAASCKREMACLHDHSCEEHDCASDWSLYKHIDISKVSALNESVAGSVESVFRSWEHRLSSSEGFLESNEGDPELLVFIPFTCDVKIKSISIVGGAGGTSPSKMRAFINRDGIDFSDAQSMQPIQEWDLAENLQGVLEYQTSDATSVFNQAGCASVKAIWTPQGDGAARYLEASHQTNY